MNFENFFNQDNSFIDEKISEINLDDYEKGWKGEITFQTYDEVITPILRNISEVTLSPSFPLDISLYLNDDDSSVEEEEVVQGGGKVILNLDLDGYILKDQLKALITTNFKITTIRIFLIPTEFIFCYQQNVEDYFPELKEEIESLCRMVMLEEDDKLAQDAIALKKSLQKVILPI